MSGNYYLEQTGQEVQDILNEVEDKTVYDDATHTSRGLMSAADKKKLDEMEDDEELSIEEIRNLLNF